jgi:hypothetical protein
MTNVLVDEFQEAMQPSIPQIIGLLSHSNKDVCKTGVNALAQLSEHCNISNFLTETSLMSL